jgi:tRNA threonylcarbamoyladenosine biosynthesis protein TsaB
VPVPEGREWHGVGSGWGTYAEVLRERLGDRVSVVRADAQCRGRDVAHIAAVDFAAGLAVPAEQALPVYLRDQVAWKRS